MTNEPSWKDVVVQALEALGGEAHLKEINRVVSEHSKARTATWQATIRRVVRQYAVFEPVAPDGSGVYRLVHAEAPRLQEAKLGGDAAELDHATAQGMLVNLGNIYGYETFVPKTDQQIRQFQGLPLAQSVSVRDCASVFSSSNVRKVREIDVLWFDEDDDGLYPVYAFEVEHTTRVRDGLDRLLKIPRRYGSRLFVIGPDATTENLFNQLIGQTPFRDYSARFAYRGYERLQAVHNAAVTHAQLRSTFGVRPRTSRASGLTNLD